MPNWEVSTVGSVHVTQIACSTVEVLFNFPLVTTNWVCVIRIGALGEPILCGVEAPASSR